MKKTLFLLCAISGLLLISCNDKNNPLPEDNPSTPGGWDTTISMNAQASILYNNLKSFAQTDKIYDDEYSYHIDWLAGSDLNIGKSFLFKTEEGIIGIANIVDVTGTNGNTNATLKLNIKTVNN